MDIFQSNLFYLLENKLNSNAEDKMTESKLKQTMRATSYLILEIKYITGNNSNLMKIN